MTCYQGFITILIFENKRVKSIHRVLLKFFNKETMREDEKGNSDKNFFDLDFRGVHNYKQACLQSP
jgi:hypothetical protein